MGNELVIQVHGSVEIIVLDYNREEICVVNLLHQEITEEEPVRSRVQELINFPGKLGIILDVADLHRCGEEPEVLLMLCRIEFFSFNLLHDGDEYCRVVP